eukprot:UN05315
MQYYMYIIIFFILTLHLIYVKLMMMS